MSKKRPNIIKDSIVILNALKHRIKVQQGMELKDVIEDAKSRGVKFTDAGISRYFKHGHVPGCLSESNIIWLCIRWGIPLNLQVGSPIDVNVKYIVPQYNEAQCLENLKKQFGYEDIPRINDDPKEENE